MDTPPAPFEALATLAAAPNSADRARTLGQALDSIPHLQIWLRQARQEAVLQMRSDGLSHADVGKELGISRARAQQIAQGLTTGKRATTNDEDSSAGPLSPAAAA